VLYSGGALGTAAPPERRFARASAQVFLGGPAYRAADPGNHLDTSRLPGQTLV